MDRKKYLELCQKNSVYPNSEKVNYKGAEYYPKALKVWFDNKGIPQNTAVIEDVNSNSVTYCKLSEVRYEN
jgi:hypothetical protein